MADEISNKTLSILVVAAIVVTLGGTMLVLRSGPAVTGLYTESVQGTAELNYTQIVSIAITDSGINFGSGTVNASGETCTMYSNGTASSGACVGGWASVASDSIDLYNDGNVDVNVSVQSDKDAETFIAPTGDGSGTSFQFVTTDMNNHCDTITSTWDEVATSGADDTVCNGWDFEETGATTEVKFWAKVAVPAAAGAGHKTATLTFTAIATSDTP